MNILTKEAIKRFFSLGKKGGLKVKWRLSHKKHFLRGVERKAEKRYGG